MAKAYFIDIVNMYCMPLGHTMYVPSVNEIYLGSGPCIINYMENHAMSAICVYSKHTPDIK